MRWELAAAEAFTRVLRRGTVRSDPRSDHTIKVVVSDLTPYTRYFYRFRARNETSPVGRTQTSPDEPGAVHALWLAPSQLGARSDQPRPAAAVRGRRSEDD